MRRGVVWGFRCASWFWRAERQIAVIGVLAVISAIVPSKPLSDLPRDRRCRGERCESGRRSFPRARLKTQRSHVFDFTAVLLEKLVELCKLLENLILKLVNTGLKIAQNGPSNRQHGVDAYQTFSKVPCASRKVVRMSPEGLQSGSRGGSETVRESRLECSIWPRNRPSYH